MYIKRDQHLRKLPDRRDNGLIKVITGVRRSGKSYLLFHLFRSYLPEHGISEDHILSMELDRWDNRKYRGPDVLMSFLKSGSLDSITVI